LNIIRIVLAPSRCVAGIALAILLAAFSSAAVAGVDLVTTIDSPEQTDPLQEYVPGTDQSFTVRVANNGDADASGVSIAYTPPSGVTVNNWVCNDAASTGTCPNQVSTNNSTSSFQLDSDQTIVFTLSVAIGSEVTGNLTNTFAASSNSTDDNPPDNTASVELAAAPEVNLVTSFDPASPSGAPTATFTPGAVEQLITITVANNGPSDASGASLAIDLPEGVATVDWACTACTTQSGSLSDASTDFTDTNEITVTYDVADEANVSVALTIDYRSDVQTGPLDFSAAASHPDETDTANDSASTFLARDAQVDLAVSVNPSSPPVQNPGPDTYRKYVPGTTDDALNISVSNAGPSDAFAATLSIELPPEVERADWTCAACTPTSGFVEADPVTGYSGPLEIPFNLASGATDLSVQLLLDYDSAALTDEIDIVVTATPADGETDPDATTDPFDWQKTNRYAIDRQADISVEKIANAEIVNPGDAFFYTITVTNHGPSDLGQGDTPGVLFTDDVPATLDGDPGNCSSEGSGPCFFVCPSDQGATGTTVSEDNCPVTVQERRGDLFGESLQIAAGNSSEVRLYVTLGDVAPEEVVTNFASVALAGPDADNVREPDNASQPNSSSDSITAELSTDLVVTKEDGLEESALESAAPGNEITYVVSVANTGSQRANGVTVTDDFPIFGEFDADAGASRQAGLEDESVTWECRAFDNACCNPIENQCGVSQPVPGAGNLMQQIVDLPGQGRVEFTITGTIDARSIGDDFTNEASITPPESIEDPNLDNNEASDTTLIRSDSNLSITKELLPIEPAVGPDGVRLADGPPYELRYRIVVSNSGPSFAFDAEVFDALTDANIDTSTATWECTELPDSPSGTSCLAAGGPGPLDPAQLVDLAPGGSVRFDVTVNTTADAAGEVRNEAEVRADGGNASVTLTSSLTGTTDLSITKTDGATSATPGTEHQYTVTVKNSETADGDSAPVFGARVTDALPPELENVVWSCEATTPIPGDLAFQAVSGAAGRQATDLVVSDDGRHIYQIQAGDENLEARIQGYLRDNVRGSRFGAVNDNEGDVEVNGENDGSDPGGPVTGMDVPVDLAMSPDQRHVYVLSNPDDAATDAPPNAIATFARSIDPAAPNYGDLSFNGEVIDGVPSDARAIAVTAENIYVAGDDAISIYRRNTASGLPTLIETITTGVPAAPAALAVDLQDRLLFVASGTGDQFATFSMNDDDSTGDPIGQLSEAAPVITVIGASAGIVDLDVYADADQVYATGSGQVALIDYSDSDNDDQPNTSFANSYSVADIAAAAISPDGEHVFTVSDSDALTYFRRDRISGTLSEEITLSAADNEGLLTPSDLVVTSDGRHVLISSAFGSSDDVSSNPLTVYSRRAPDPLFDLIETDVHLDNASPTSSQKINALESPSDIAISPDGEHVYTVSLSQGAISAFKRTPSAGLGEATAGEHLEFIGSVFNGEASAATVVSGMSAPRYVLVNPAGDKVFVTSEDGDSLAVFDRETDSSLDTFGQLTFRDAFVEGEQDANGDVIDGLAGARGMAMDSSGDHLYVAGGFDAAIAVFARKGETLDWIGVVENGANGFQGLAGIRDLTLSDDDLQLIGASEIADAVVVMDRDPNTGLLTFLQKLQIGIGDQPMSVAASPDGRHVYVASQNADSISVLRRETDPASTSFGALFPVAQQFNRTEGIEFMDGPRSVEVSPDGKRVYVASEFSSSLIVFDRDTNASSARFGTLTQSSVSRDGIDSVDGLDRVYSLVVSSDSRNVYTAGFGDRAVSSFVLGIGSVCSSGGSGSIDDLVTIGRNGTLEYRITADIRPDAIGTLANPGDAFGFLINTATVTPPQNVTDPVPGNNQATDDDTLLVPKADLSIRKTNDRVSVVAGQRVTYEIEVTNAGPSNLVSKPGYPVAVRDLLGDYPYFDADSVAWVCEAEGSGALTFTEALVEDNEEPDPGPDLGLEGVSSLAFVPDSDGDGPVPRLLASVSVTDNALSLFSRDPINGSLILEALVKDGDTLGADLVDTLAGARAVVASSDGAFLYVASQVDDSLTVFSIEYDTGADAGTSSDDLIRLVKGPSVSGSRELDQASDLVIDDGDRFLFVAAANSDSVSVFEHDRSADSLSLVDVEIDGVDDATDTGLTAQGLNGVTGLVLSPQGDQLYAVSATARAISRFDVAASGELTWVAADTAAGLDVELAGAAAVTMDRPNGKHLYISAGAADRVVVLGRDADPLSGTYGSLTRIDEVVLGENGVTGLLGPRDLELSSDGLHLYVASQTSGSVTWFLRDRTIGTLEFGGVLTNQSSVVSGMSGATALVVDSDPVYDEVLVAGTLDAAIVRFDRRSDSFCEASGDSQLDAERINIAAGGTVRFQLSALISPDAIAQLELLDPDAENPLLENTAIVTPPQGPDPAVPTDPNPDNNISTDRDVVEVVADLRISKDDGKAEFDGLSGADALAGDGKIVYAAGAGDDAIGMFARIDDPGDPLVHGRLRFIGVAQNGEAGVDGLTDVTALALSADGGNLYAVSPADNALVSFARLPNSGLLEFLGESRNGALGVAGIGGATDVALSPDDRHVYVAGGLDNSIAAFSRDADPLSETFGELTFLGQQQNGTAGVAGLTGVESVALSGDGSHVYAVSPIDNSIALFTRNPNEGSAAFGRLSFEASYEQNVGGVAGMSGAVDVVVAGNDEDVYVLGSTTGTLARFERDAFTGELTFIEFKQDGTAGTTGLTGASAMRISPDGAHLYVAGTEADAVVWFTIASDGSLDFAGLLRDGDATANGGQVIGLDGPSDVLLAPDGDQVYTSASVSNALATLKRTHTSDAATNSGALEYIDVLIDGLGGVAPGSEVIYTIVVENLGPSDVGSVTVIDDFPNAFSEIDWRCTASAVPDETACAFNTGSGSINETGVVLPAGGTVTYKATAIVREDATGRLVNTASVSGLGVQDPVIANNSATDDDTVLSPIVDLVTRVELVVDPISVVDPSEPAPRVVPGAPLEYAVIIRNDGPSLATDARVRDIMPPALFDVEWSCTALPVEGLLSSIGTAPAALESVRALTVAGNGAFAYAVGSVFGGTGALTVFQRDSVTGGLSVIETYRDGQRTADFDPVIQGMVAPADIVASRDGAHLFVAAPATDSVLSFTRDAESGLLTFVGQYRDGDAGIDGLGGVAELAVDPRGDYLYAGGRIDDAIAVFAIDSANGALSYAGQASQGTDGVDGLNGVSGLVWSDDYLFVVAEDNLSLAAFEQDSATGLLTQVGYIQNSELSPPTTPASLNVPSDVLIAGSEIVVSSRDGGAISRFTFDVERSPKFVRKSFVKDVAGMVAPESIVYSPKQQRLYVASNDAIHLFSLRADQPELLAQYDIPELSGLVDIALPVDDGPLYSLAAPGALAVLARQAGSLCPLGGEDELGEHDVEIASGGTLEYSVRGTVFANASGTLVYEAGAESLFVEREEEPADNFDVASHELTPAPDLDVFSKRADYAEFMGSDGVPLGGVVAGTPISYQIDFRNLGLSDALAAVFNDAPPMHPQDPGLVPASATWACEANPALEYGAGLTTAEIPELAGLARLQSNADGTRLLGLNPLLDTLVLLAIGPDGSLSVERRISEGQEISQGEELNPIEVAGLAGASSAVESEDGRSIYVTGEAVDSLVVFTRGPEGLIFEQRFQSGQGDVSGLQGPQDVVLSPDERFVFVAATVSDAITVFSRDPDSGRLTFVERVRDGFGTIVPDSDVLRGVRRLLVSGDGRFLHALAPTSNSIATFEIDSETGALTYLRALQTGDPGATGLDDAVEFIASPGDGHIYVASPGADAIVIYQRDDESGILSLQNTAVADGASLSPLNLAMDLQGRRLYVTGSDGSLHLFSRDWATGSLEYRLAFGAGSNVPASPQALVHVGAVETIYIADANAATVDWYGELPLARCFTETGASDAVSIEVDLAPDASGIVSYGAMVHPAARGDLINLATLEAAAGEDPDGANDSETDTTKVVAVSEIAIEKNGPADAVAGEIITYEIVATNAGPSDALGAVIADTPPPVLTDIEWSCTATDGSICPASGSGAPDFPATIRADGSVTVTMQGRIDSSFIGNMTNSVVLTPEPESTDPNGGDRSDQVGTEVVAVADVSVAKTTLTAEVVAGLPVSWRIDVINNGPSDAPSVDIADTLPEGLSNPTWTCAASGGASCPAGGTDAPDFNAAMPAGSSLEIVIDADLAAAATGNLVNTATADVAAPVNEPNLSNNTATASDVIVVRSDMAIELIAPRNPFDPAGPIELPLNVSVVNLGPSNSRNVDVLIDFSAPVQQTSPGCTQPSATQVRCLISQLDPGGTRLLELSLTGLPAAPSTLVADGLVLTSAEDVNALNDTDSVSIELLTGSDLDVSIDNGTTWLSPGEPAEYVIRIRNLGSLTANGAGVSLPVDADLLNANWTCAATGGGVCTASGVGDLDDLFDLPAGGELIYTLLGDVDPAVDLLVPVSVDMAVAVQTVPDADDINPANNVAFDQDEVRLVMFEDGFEAIIVPALLSAEPGDPEECTEVHIGAVAGSTASASLLAANAEPGAEGFWLDSVSRDRRHWLRLSVLDGRSLQTSGWVPWMVTDGDIAVRLHRGRPELRFGREAAWSAGNNLPMVLRGWVRRSATDDAMSLTTCADAGTLDTGRAQ